MAYDAYLKRTEFKKLRVFKRSHRPSETEDSFSADLDVGVSCGQVKFGALSKSEGWLSAS